DHDPGAIYAPVAPSRRHAGPRHHLHRSPAHLRRDGLPVLLHPVAGRHAIRPVRRAVGPRAARRLHADLFPRGAQRRPHRRRVPDLHPQDAGGDLAERRRHHHVRLRAVAPGTAFPPASRAPVRHPPVRERRPDPVLPRDPLDRAAELVLGARPARPRRLLLPVRGPGPFHQLPPGGYRGGDHRWRRSLPDLLADRLAHIRPDHRDDRPAVRDGALERLLLAQHPGPVRPAPRDGGPAEHLDQPERPAGARLRDPAHAAVVHRRRGGRPHHPRAGRLPVPPALSGPGHPPRLREGV
ncbi:MAG: Maltodextrin ABC transporter, permease protein MdxG, partial [uncultured Thermomicrobiales bacterium]